MGKRTVWLSDEQEATLEASGLRMADIVRLGLETAAGGRTQDEKAPARSRSGSRPLGLSKADQARGNHPRRPL